MNEQELREKIEKVLGKPISCIQGAKTATDCGMKDLPYYLATDFQEKLTRQIIVLIKEALPELAKEAGYVKLREGEHISGVGTINVKQED